MAEVNDLITLKPQGVGGWTMDLKCDTISMGVVGSPEVKGGTIINGQLKVDDICITSSAVVNLNLSVRVEETTYLALKQSINKIQNTILTNSVYELDIYYYDPDTKTKVIYDNTNFPIASYMQPFSDPSKYKWLLTATDDLEDGKSPEAKLLKVDGKYSKKIKLVFRSLRYK